MSSTHLLRHGEPTVRPQDDLFDHVNGTFMKQTKILSDREGAGVWYEVHDRVRRDLEHIIANIGTGHVKGTPAQLVGDFYASFTDLPRLASQGDTQLKELIACATTFDSPRGLSQQLGRLMRYQLNSALTLQVVVDQDNPTRYLPRFSPGGIGLPDADYYLADQFAGLREAYLAHIERLFTLVDLPDAKASAQAAFRIETQLASLHADTVTARDLDATYNLFSFSQVQYLTKNLSWIPLLYEVDLHAEADPCLIVSQPDFVRGLDAMLTPDRMDEWRAWVAWRIVYGLADYSTAVLAAAQWQFADIELGGLETVQSRSARGLAHIEHFLGDAMGQLYVEKHFTSVAASKVEQLVSSIITEYRHTLANVYWMTTPTREAALDKLSQLSVRVGFPRWWHDYDSLDLRPDDLFGNVLRAASHLTETEIGHLMGRQSGEDWQVPPHVVNAYYDVSRNEIILPAAFLQTPFFDPEAEDGVNYGAIGTIIAHEISHAFDDRGSKFDAFGRFHDWWTPSDREAFTQLRHHFVEQLDATFSPDLPDVRLNGQLVVSEAMSDLGGLAVAYRAWRRTEPDDSLLEDGVTPAQRFFFSYAGIWRNKEVLEETRYRLANDPHPPNKVRCDFTVRNFDPFQVAFKVCPQDAMWRRPGERLAFW